MYYFDTLILMLLVITILPGIFFLILRIQNKWIGARLPRFTVFLAILFLFGGALIAYGSFIEPRLIVVNRQTIDLDNIDEQITIALVSDFQVGPYKKADFVLRVAQKILALKPDLVFIAGDLIDNDIDDNRDETVELLPLQKLAAQIPTYAVHGNHEYGAFSAASRLTPSLRFTDKSTQVKAAAEALGIEYLVNTVTEITVRSETFTLFGGEPYWANTLDFGVLNLHPKKEQPVIALMHDPTPAPEASRHEIDLLLAGHTHGGQIRLPFFGPIGRVDTTANLPKEWYQGFHMVNDLQLFVTSGVGESGTRARLFNPPEIVLLTVL